jgi:hypothetical protein
MSRSSRHPKKRKERFVGIPYHIVCRDEFINLSHKAKALLIDLLHQYHGANNGSQSACWTLMRERGWKSSSTLYRAFKELQETGFVIITRQGFKIRGKPTLCAITWRSIDDAKVPYDDGIKVSNIPLNTWRKK